MNLHLIKTDEGKVALVNEGGVRDVIKALFILFETLDKGQQERVIEKLKEEVKS